ncbi:response regulator [Clostridium sp. YIM B02569]|uniref:response regulator n=1 Tax=Clostridium sp. YIM B02569 TaxID=2911967 RepID=UPI001EEA8A77|nr:response regulator [Clostridium sp. YIM B02569]
MIKAMVVDDETLTNDHICELIRDTGAEVEGYTNPHEALDSIMRFKPDVLFLDIEMPEINGLQFAEIVNSIEHDCEIVFITAYNQYAINAFRVNAIDYLLKPIIVEELYSSIERVKKRRFLISSVSPNKEIKISLFGGVSLYIGDEKKPIRWMTAKSAEIFAFMLLGKDDKEISKWRLMNEVWPDKDKEKADINLRSTISRLNKTFRENSIKISIISTGNGYKLLIAEPDIRIDAFELENLVFSITEIDDSNLECYESIILDYKYMLLEDFNSDWCYFERENYHRYFLNGARKLVKYYKDINAEPIKILRLVELIIKYEPYDEEMRENALMFHYKIGGIKKAEKYYNEYYEMMENDLQMEPSAAVKELYKYILDN